MQRRTFIAGFGVLLAGLGAGQIGRADTRDQGTLEALRIRLNDGRLQTVTGFELTAAQRSLGLRWSQMIPAFDENRVDFSGAGAGLGGLFRTPFRVRWSQAAPIGEIELIGAALVARIADLSPFVGARVTVAAGDFSWDLPASLASVPSSQGRGQPVGAVRVGDDGRVLVSLAAQPAF